MHHKWNDNKFKMKKEDKKIREKTRVKDVFGKLKNWKLNAQKFKDERREEDIERDESLSRALLSESAFAKDWLSEEEDEAWKDL